VTGQQLTQLFSVDGSDILIGIETYATLLFYAFLPDAKVVFVPVQDLDDSIVSIAKG
jgi:hypothetical protein